MKKSATLLLIFILSGTLNLFAQQQQQQPAPFIMRDGACSGIPPANISGDPDRDGNGTLGQSLNITRCGLDYVTASKSITTRYTQAFGPPNTGFPATLTIAGIPAGAVIEKALLYWIVSYHTGSSLTPTAVLTNPSAVSNNFVATMIGSGPSKCWGETGTRAFRVDVTSAVAGNGNYILNNIIGILPWGGQPSWEVDGATLMIIYSDPLSSFKGTLAINDGMVVGIATTTTLAVANFQTCSNSSYIDGFVMASDLQNNIGGPNPQHTCTINGNNYLFPNNFWNFDRIATTTTGCQSSGNFGIIPTPGDCYSYCASGIYYRIPTCGPGCPNTMQLVTNFTNPTCGLLDGTASVAALCGAAPYTFLWSTGATTAAITGLGAGTYTVTVTDACQCLTGTATIVLTSGPLLVLSTTTIDLTCYNSGDGSATVNVLSGGIPPYIYGWNSIPPQVTATATGLAAGTYTVIATDSIGCTATATVLITEPTQVVASTQNIVHTLCALSNGSAEAVGTGGTGAFTFLWSTSPPQMNAIASNLAPGTYTVIVADANNCTATATVTINASTIPVVVPIIVGPNPICITQPTMLDAGESLGTPPYSYHWYQPPVGLSSYTVKSPVANPLVTTTFTVDVTDANGCLSLPNSITVDVYTPLTVTATGTTSICVGESTGITANGSGGNSNLTFSWDNSLGNGTGPFTVSPTVTTTYTVSLTDGCGTPSVSSSVTVTVDPTPVVDFNFISVSECPPYTAKFADLSSVLSPSTLNQWLWSFGDGGTSVDQHPSHGYLAGGTYMIALTIVTNAGCSAMDSIEQVIEVAPEYTFYIPNAFTPNGDRINEYFFPMGESIKNYDMVIYDRWGIPVFKSNDIRFAWDGKLSSGELANEGIYNYMFDIKDVCGHRHRYNGSIALIR